MVLMGPQNNKRAQESEEKFWAHAQRLERDPFYPIFEPMSDVGGGLNRSTQHFILEGKDGV